MDPSHSYPDTPDQDHPEFDNDSTWPRRLLHVPSMTSYKWAPGNFYGKHREPPYVALSYTWGRFQLNKDEKPAIKSVKIHGVPWAIPRIDPGSHFTMEEFKTVIQETMKTPKRFYIFDDSKMETARRWTTLDRWIFRPILRWLERRRNVYEFLWLDIACIEQRDSAIQKAEVGRQARIFGKAVHSYTWLSHLTHIELDKILQDLEKVTASLQCEPFSQTAVKFETRPSLKIALQAFQALTNDPWFTSLWTLQEAFLCNHAMLLSREALVSCDSSLISPQSWSLNALFRLANDIILWSERTKARRAEPEFSELIELIRSSGLSALWNNNPMGLLGVSNDRQTSRYLDRVYGIMQIFGTDFKVGLSQENADQSREYSLPELEDEFGAAIVDRYPILSQMHIYLEEPNFSKGWCVRGSSVVPHILERGDMFGWDSGNRIETNIVINSVAVCELSTRFHEGNQWAYLRGKACLFEELQRAWWEADQSDRAHKIRQSGWRMHRNSTQTIHVIALDRKTPLEPLLGPFSGVNIVSIQDQNLQHDLAAWMAKQSSRLQLKVFLLGKCAFGDESFSIGLIIYHVEKHGVSYWHRAGICLWLTSHLLKDGIDHSTGPLLRGDHHFWENIEGLFG